MIDFQDAMIGPSTYDVASLVQDARKTVSAALEKRLLDAYISHRLDFGAEFDISDFHKSYAIMAAQRATKVLGIFVRLDERDGKPDYLAHLPRIETYLRHSLQHPALVELKQWCEQNIEL
jgi:aminoglycoside/choline kinase family phosphotransferase